jgi:hypothetical protein
MMAEDEEENALSQYVAVINSTLNGLPLPLPRQISTLEPEHREIQDEGGEKSKIMLPHCNARYRAVNMQSMNTSRRSRKKLSYCS